MEKRTREIPSLLLEQYVLGELSEGRKEKLEAEFGLEYLSEKTRDIEKQNRLFLQAHTPGEMKYQIIKKQDADAKAPAADPAEVRSIRNSGMLVPLLTAAVFVLLFAGLFPVFRNRGGDLPQDVRIKGAGTHLQIFKEENGSPVMLSEGDLIRENDVLQIKYIPSGKKYGIIFSIDGRGNVTRLFPESGREAAALTPESPGIVQFGYQLDDAPKFERFFFITSDTSFTINRVVRAAEVLSKDIEEAAFEDLTLPKGIEQSSFLLEKAEN